MKNELKRRPSFQFLSIKYLLLPKHWTISYWHISEEWCSVCWSCQQCRSDGSDYIRMRSSHKQRK